jgi:hypothetical protein
MTQWDRFRARYMLEREFCNMLAGGYAWVRA